MHSVDESGAYVSPGAGSTQVSIREIQTSSGASVMDSTNNAIGVTIRAGSAAGTEYTDGDVDATPSGGAVFFDHGTNTMRVVTSTRGLPVNVVAGSAASTTVNVSSLAGAVVVRSSAASLLATIYQSTAADLNVTVAGYVAPSTLATVRQSTIGDFKAAVYQSTAADLNVTVAGYSTTVNVSSLAGAVIVRSSAASLLGTVYQSTAADLNVTVAGYSTTVNVSSLAGAVTARTHTSSGGAVEGSTSTPSTGSVLGLNVRPVQPSGRQSTTILVLNQTADGSTTLISSAAALRHFVSAYSITSTVVGPSSCAFRSSAAIERWGLLLGSGSSGITGANLAVSQPGFLFATDAANALTFSASSTGHYKVSLTWFTEA